MLGIRKESQVDPTEPPKKKAENVPILAEESCSSGGEDGEMKPLDDRSEMWGTPKVGGLSSFSPSKMPRTRRACSRGFEEARPKGSALLSYPNRIT
jgi:hypothetical protein